MGGKGSGKKKSKKEVAEKTGKYVSELTKAQRKEMDLLEPKSKKKPDKYVMVKTDDIEFTQGYIRKCLDKEEDTLAEVCHYLMKAYGPYSEEEGDYTFSSEMSGFSMIGIAQKDGEGKYFTRDNRRLFIAKVLGIEEIPCMLFEWGDEFDKKNDDAVKYKDLQTSADGIDGFRKKQLKKQLQDDEDMREHSDDTEYVVHVPSKYVGVVVGKGKDGYQKTRIGMQNKHKCTISVFEERFEVGFGLYTPICVWPRGADETKADRAHAAIKQIKQIINWGCEEIGKEERFFPKVKLSNEEEEG